MIAHTFIISMLAISLLAWFLITVTHSVKQNIVATSLTTQPQIYKMGIEDTYFTFQPETQDVYIMKYTFCTVAAQQLLLSVDFEEEDRQGDHGPIPQKSGNLSIEPQSCLILLILVSPLKSSLDQHFKKIRLGIKLAPQQSKPPKVFPGKPKQPFPWTEPLTLYYQTPLPSSHALGAQSHLIQVSFQPLISNSGSSVKAEIYFSIYMFLFLIILSVLLQLKYKWGGIFTIQFIFDEDVVSTNQQAKNLVEINRLIPKQPYKQKNQNQECSICLLEFIQGEETRVTRCKHIFHADCIDNWCAKKMNCPICRANLSVVEDIKRVYLQARERLFQLRLEYANLIGDE